MKDSDLAMKLLILGVVLAAIFLGFAGGKFTIITGAATGTAWMNVSATVSISMTDSLVNFTNGSHTGATSYATLETNGTAVSGGTWPTINDNFTITNTGNVLANITISSGTGPNWVGGTTVWQLYAFAWTNATGNSSCLLAYNSTTDGTNGPGTMVHERNWHNITAASTAYGLCQRMNFTDNYDNINVWLKVYVPIDTTGGIKTDTLTFSAATSS